MSAHESQTVLRFNVEFTTYLSGKPTKHSRVIVCGSSTEAWEAVKYQYPGALVNRIAPVE